jgi:hypothetical protein
MSMTSVSARGTPRDQCDQLFGFAAAPDGQSNHP